MEQYEFASRGSHIVLLTPLPTTTYSHPSPPKLHPRKRVWRVASNRILVFAQRFWDRHKANIATRWKDVCERLVRRPKQQFWREIITFYPKWIWVMLIQGKCKFLFQQPWNMISKVYRLTFLHAQVLSWNWHRVMVSKFRNIRYKSPRKNSTKLFPLGLVIQKSGTTAPGLVHRLYLNWWTNHSPLQYR